MTVHVGTNAEGLFVERSARAHAANIARTRRLPIAFQMRMGAQKRNIVPTKTAKETIRAW